MPATCLEACCNKVFSRTCIFYAAPEVEAREQSAAKEVEAAAKVTEQEAAKTDLLKAAREEAARMAEAAEDEEEARLLENARRNALRAARAAGDL